MADGRHLEKLKTAISPQRLDRYAQNLARWRRVWAVDRATPQPNEPSLDVEKWAGMQLVLLFYPARINELYKEWSTMSSKNSFILGLKIKGPSLCHLQTERNIDACCVYTSYAGLSPRQTLLPTAGFSVRVRGVFSQRQTTLPTWIIHSYSFNCKTLSERNFTLKYIIKQTDTMNNIAKLRQWSK